MERESAWMIGVGADELHALHRAPDHVVLTALRGRPPMPITLIDRALGSVSRISNGM